MKILITGAAGFIGYHLSQKLAQLQHEVIGLDSINDYYDVDLKYARLSELGIKRNVLTEGTLAKSELFDNFKFIQLDMGDTGALNSLFAAQNFDIIINLAAQAGVRYSISHPQAYINNNVVAFFNILECARHHQIKHLIYASSSSVYGINSDVPFNEELRTDKPVSLYAATKKSNELMAYTYSHLYKIPTTGLRFFTVYGPWGRPDMSPILFANAIVQGSPIKVFNNGNLSRDFTYVDDIINGVCQVLDSPPPRLGSGNSELSSPPYRLFNIGNNSPVKLMYFIELIEKAMGKEAIKEMYPMQQGDVYETYADISSLEQFTGYNPTTTIEEGVVQFANWFKAYYCS
jgi:UDP-glucuronate 4-epimerase